LDGRWAVLATRAARTGAIDYAKTTRDDIFSIMRESLILRDVKREMLTNSFGMFDLIYTNPQSRVFRDQFIANGFPWFGGPRTKEEAQKAMIDDLVATYKEFEEYEKKRLEEQDGRKRTDQA
jgi:hypothetical protein